jgi:hypothetical protein
MAVATLIQRALETALLFKVDASLPGVLSAVPFRRSPVDLEGVALGSRLGAGLSL